MQEPAQASPQPASAGERFPLALVADEAVSEQAKLRARKLVLRVAGDAPRPVLHARIVLRQHPDPAVERPATASASLDVSGRAVRAHAAARQMLEAVDLLEQRLRRNLDDLSPGGGTRRA